MKRKSKPKRKNPNIDDFFIRLLAKAFLNPSAGKLTDLIKYLNQGKKCDDCDEYFEFCKCEECPDCEFDRCLCHLNIDIDAKMDSLKAEKIRKEIIKIIKKNLNKQQIEHFQDKLNEYMSYNRLTKVQKIQIHDLFDWYWKDINYGKK